MGMKAMEEIVAGLLAAGLPATLPAAIVTNATTYRQQELRSTLGRVVEDAREAALEPPGLLIIGETVALAPAKQHARENIVVTSSRIPRLLQETHPAARWLWRPLTAIVALDATEREALRERFLAALTADWIVFNSRPAATEFLRILNGFGLDARRLTGRIASIGEETAAALAEGRIVADVTAVDGETAGLAAVLDSAGAARGRVVLPCSTTYGGRLSAVLKDSGEVLELPVYHNRPNQPTPVEWRFVHKVFFASPSAVSRFTEVFPEAPLAELTALAIGESVSQKALELGFKEVERLAGDGMDAPAGAVPETA
jgi:uroporphyrinogen-III synthase